MTALEKYWENCFKEFARGGGEFSVPGFPDPLLSPRFGLRDDGPHFNVISVNDGISRQEAHDGYRLRNEFLLGTFDLGRSLPVHEFQSVSLRQVLKDDAYWSLLGQGFPADLPFLRLFLPFLAARPAKSRVLVNDGLSGAVTVVAAGDVALVMNLVVGESRRGTWLGPRLIQAAKYEAQALGARTAVYWTQYETLLRFADERFVYRVFVKD